MRNLAVCLLSCTALLMAVPRARAEDGKQVLLAEKTGAKKKKKKKKAEDDGATDFGPGDIEPSTHEQDSGSGFHREQEGVEKPYLVELAGLTSISMLTVKAGEGDPEKSTQIAIGGEMLFILGHIEIGPALTFNNYSSKQTATSVDPTTGASTTTSQDYKAQDIGIGPAFKFNFADVDHSDLVPFARVSIEYTTGSTKSGDNDAVKETGNRIRIGGGLNFFLSSHVSFQPQIDYLLQSSKADSDGAEETKTSGLEILFGLGDFI